MPTLDDDKARLAPFQRVADNRYDACFHNSNVNMLIVVMRRRISGFTRNARMP